MMMKINFHPDSDALDVSHAISEYQRIWSIDGERIVAVWQEVTRLTFKETEINAVVFEAGPSRSHPLSLRASLDYERKKSVLVHEIGHRLLYGRTVQPDFSSLENHKTLFLVLHEVLVRLYGSDFAQAAVAWDRQLPNEIYRIAWEWALQLSPTERADTFAARVCVE